MKYCSSPARRHSMASASAALPGAPRAAPGSASGSASARFALGRSVVGSRCEWQRQRDVPGRHARERQRRAQRARLRIVHSLPVHAHVPAVEHRDIPPRDAASGVHCSDKVGSALLLLSSLFMDPVNNGLRAPTSSTVRSSASSSSTCSCGWGARPRLLSFHSRGCAARVAAELVSSSRCSAMGPRGHLAWNNEDFSESAALDVAAALMWGSNIWLFLRRGFRAFGAMTIPGQHLPSSARWSATISRSSTTATTSSCSGRWETVLQIVIASMRARAQMRAGFPRWRSRPSSPPRGFPRRSTLMFSFQQINAGQHHASHHLNADIEEQQEEEAAIMDMVISGRALSASGTCGRG